MPDSRAVPEGMCVLSWCSIEGPHEHGTTTNAALSVPLTDDGLRAAAQAVLGWMDEARTLDRHGECPVCFYVGETHRDGCPVPRLRAALATPAPEPGIDVEWAKVEAALPDGWSFGLTGDGWYGWEVEAHADAYEFDGDRALSTGTLGAFETPAAALRALADRLAIPSQEDEPHAR